MCIHKHTNVPIYVKKIRQCRTNQRVKHLSSALQLIARVYYFPSKYDIVVHHASLLNIIHIIMIDGAASY